MFMVMRSLPNDMVKTATLDLRFVVTDASNQYIDLGQCLSLVNRRLYRQGYVYRVESFSWNPGANSSLLNIATVPSTWVTYNAWKKAKALWNKMNRMSGIQKPAYHDFKVFMDELHYTNMGATYSSNNLIPRDFGGVLYASNNAEWQYSQFVTPTAGGSSAAAENCAHMLGADTGTNNATLSTDGSHAVIQGYADTRVTVGLDEPELPGDASTSWQTELFDAGEVEVDIINHLEGHNDQPPYAHGTDIQGGDDPIYPGGSGSALNGHWCVQVITTQGETAYAPGCDVPLGLMEVSASAAGTLEVRVAPGRYNGAAAVRMESIST